MAGRRRQRLAAALLAAVALTGCGDDGASGTGQAYPERTAAGVPNLLLITTDDQTLSAYGRASMPFTSRLFGRRGVTFTRAIAAPPLCCPARAGILSGQYVHNHGVDANVPGYAKLDNKANILPAWLDRAGYETALIGKYLNLYDAVRGNAPDAGWDRWFAISDAPGYDGFAVSVDGEQERRDGYSTTELAAETVRFTTAAARAARPFFAWLALNAPHTVPEGEPPCAGGAAQPERRSDYRPFAAEPLPAAGSPSFDERDVSDKARPVRDKVRLRDTAIAEMERRWRCQLAALRSVDRAVRAITAALREHGQLRRTVIVFHSDNGYFHGEHRFTGDKRYPYEEALRIPFAVLAPGAAAGARSPAPVSTVDIAATLLDYAGADPCLTRTKCRTLDGRSLRPLIEGGRPRWTRDRAIPLSLDDGFTYEAIRTPRYMLMRLLADRAGPLPQPQFELYDLRSDPAQLDSIGAREEPGLFGRLRSRLELAVRCAGTSGRRACD